VKAIFPSYARLSSADQAERFLDRIAPILSRSCPAALFVLDDLIASSESRLAIRGRMGWNAFDRMRNFRFRRASEIISAAPRGVCTTVSRRFEEKNKEFLTTEDTEDTEVRKARSFSFFLCVLRVL
jgi:hypothetical protein